MTSPYARALPPLRDLPAPPRLPLEDPELVPPAQIMLDSRRELTLRLLRAAWVPALLLVALWLVLWCLFVIGSAPTMWTLSLLFGLAEPMLLNQTLAALGFSRGALGLSVLLVPLLAPLLSLATLPLAAWRVAGIDPAAQLSEQDFQRAVASRISSTLLAPVLAVIALTAVLGAVDGPIPWNGLGAGPLMAVCLALLAVQATGAGLRRWLGAPRLLGVNPVGELRRTALIGQDPRARREAAAQLLATDRRHLPPTPGSEADGAGLTRAGMQRSLAAIAGASRRWFWPVLLAGGWLTFSVADLVLTFSGLAATELTAVPSPLGPVQAAVVLPVALLTALALAPVPGLAARLVEGRRGAVSDLRTYEDWSHRARVNPWESGLVAIGGWIGAGVVAAGIAVTTTILAVTGLHSALTWSGAVVLLLLAVPMAGLTVAAALRRDARTVLYGPAGRYTRRATPFRLVAPSRGTRAQRAADPAVRAEMRRRIAAEGGDPFGLRDLDAEAGDRLWVDDSQPGARAAEVRQGDVEQGRLPDFGGEGSPFSAPGEDAYEIPETVTRLPRP
ncbi:hypothetical protein [Brachybacterium squillarum]|uniref:hypothetical protein n=1 Tax=Brachybacterium squillarum TaxID=661979 RepID=UPI0022234C44|nr:hypothetical protein [Brachybacterium squillarum]MCW1805052.1 hypothetical protein [Brachybacterium squillarum]